MTRCIRRARLHIPVCIALVLGCGGRSATHSRPAPAPQIRAADVIARWFPASPSALLSDPTLDHVPRAAFAVAVVPTVADAYDWLGLSALNADARAAILEEWDIDIDEMLSSREQLADAGIALDRPMAVALLDTMTLAVVLPLRDADAFESNEHWSEVDSLIRGPYGVVVVGLHEDADVYEWYDTIEYLGDEDVEDSAPLSQSAGLAAARQELDYAPGAAIFLNTDAIRRAAAQRFEEMNEELEEADYDEEDLEEAMEEGDDEWIAEIQHELDRVTAQREALARQPRLVDELLRPIRGVAIGLGLADGSLRIRATAAFRSQRKGWAVMAAGTSGGALGGADVGVTLALPPQVSADLVRLFIDDSTNVKLDKLLAAAAVNARRDVAAALTTRIRIGVSLDDTGDRVHAHPRIELGLRDPIAVDTRVSERAGAPGVRGLLRRGAITRDTRTGGVRVGNWVLWLDRDRLLLQGGSTAPKQPAARASSGPSPIIAALGRPADVAGRIGVRPVLAALGRLYIEPDEDDDDEEEDDDDSRIQLLNALHGQPGAETLTELQNRREAKQKAFDIEVRRARDAVFASVGVGAGFVRVDADSIDVYAALDATELGRMGQRAVLAWYLTRDWSAEAVAIEELKDEIRVELQNVVHIAGQLPQPGGSPRSGGRASAIQGGVPGGQPSAEIQAKDIPPSVRATTSIGAVTGAISRARASEQVLALTPRLRVCYAGLLRDVPRAAGYLTARLDIARGIPGPPALTAARSAIALSTPDFARCAAAHLRTLRFDPKVSGAITAILWFGRLPD